MIRNFVLNLFLTDALLSRLHYICDKCTC